MKKLTFIFGALVLLLLPAQALAEEQVGDGTVSIRPVESEQETPIWFTYQAKPGDVIEDEILVINASNETSTIELYAIDSTLTTSGNFTLLPKNSENSVYLNNWIEIKKPEVTVKAGGWTVVPFTLTIPEDTPLEDYTGGIVFESASGNDGTFDIKTRSGSRVYLTVTDNPQPLDKWRADLPTLSYLPYIIFSAIVTGLALLLVLLIQFDIVKLPKK